MIYRREDMRSMQLAQNRVLRLYSGDRGVGPSGSATRICYKVTWWVNKFGYLESGLDLMIFNYLLSKLRALRRTTGKLFRNTCISASYFA
jgi:hypothetical protein